jgi:hypothetical protein
VRRSASPSSTMYSPAYPLNFIRYPLSAHHSRGISTPRQVLLVRHWTHCYSVSGVTQSYRVSAVTSYVSGVTQPYYVPAVTLRVGRHTTCRRSQPANKCSVGSELGKFSAAGFRLAVAGAKPKRGGGVPPHVLCRWRKTDVNGYSRKPHLPLGK